MNVMRTIITVVALAMLPAITAPSLAAEPAKQTESTAGKFNCTTDKEKITSCERKATEETFTKLPAGETAKQAKAKECKFRCTIHCPDGGGSCIEICRGNGPQCNGKEPGPTQM